MYIIRSLQVSLWLPIFRSLQADCSASHTPFVLDFLTMTDQHRYPYDWPLSPSLLVDDSQQRTTLQEGSDERSCDREIPWHMGTNAENEAEMELPSNQESTEDHSQTSTYQRPKFPSESRTLNSEKFPHLPTATQQPGSDDSLPREDDPPATLQRSQNIYEPTNPRPCSHVAKPISANASQLLTDPRHTVHFAKSSLSWQTTHSPNFSPSSAPPTPLNASLLQARNECQEVRPVSQFVASIRQREDIVGRRINPKLARLRGVNYDTRFSGSRDFGSAAVQKYFPELAVPPVPTLPQKEGASKKSIPGA